MLLQGCHSVYGLRACPYCGQDPVLHCVTEVVYDADPRTGAELGRENGAYLQEKGIITAERRVYTVKDDGIFIIECPNNCIGIEASNCDTAIMEWRQYHVDRDGYPTPPVPPLDAWWPVSGDPLVR